MDEYSEDQKACVERISYVIQEELPRFLAAETEWPEGTEPIEDGFLGDWIITMNVVPKTGADPRPWTLTWTSPGIPLSVRIGLATMGVDAARNRD